MFNIQVDGNKTLGENIADNGGFKAAYHAYVRWASKNQEEARLPRFENYTPKQLFWLSTANMWCTKISPGLARNLIRRDVHSPAEFRINGPFSNLAEFSNDFGCKLGTNMNPINKCSVW